jgi:hypothetical protein
MLGTSAFAAGQPTNATNPSNESTSAQLSQNLPKEIQSKLEQDGFTNVQIVPGSFLVRAKDKGGDPVTMVIGPHSMMMLTQMPNASNNSTTGSGSSGSQNSSSNSSGSK